MKKYIVAYFVLATSMCSLNTQAQTKFNATTPYMPTWVARHYIQWLADQQDLTLLTTQWPLPSGVLAHSLYGMPHNPQAGDSEARLFLQNELALLQNKGFLQHQSRNQQQGLVGFAENYSNGVSAILRSAELLAGQADGFSFAGRLGTRVESKDSAIPEHSNFSAEGSTAVLGFGGWNAQLFSHQFWWGPGWQSSLVNSNNIPAWQGVGLQRGTIKASDIPWLAWVGPWNLDVFVAKAQDPLIVPNQHQGFLFSGTRLTIKPLPWLEMGFSRGMQSGGTGRSDSVGTFVKAFFGQQVNKDPWSNFQDSSGQIAGYDIRLRCPLSWSGCAAYTQLIGEDAAGKIPLPYKFMSLWGFENTFANGRYRVFVEYADTNIYSLPWDNKPKSPGYVNGVYQQGYTNGGRWAGASQGSGATVTTLGWMDAASMQIAKLYFGRIQSSVGIYSPRIEQPKGRMWGLSAQQTMPWKGMSFTPELIYNRFEKGANFAGGQRYSFRAGIAVTIGL